MAWSLGKTDLGWWCGRGFRSVLLLIDGGIHFLGTAYSTASAKRIVLLHQDIPSFERPDISDEELEARHDRSEYYLVDDATVDALIPLMDEGEEKVALLRRRGTQLA